MASQSLSASFYSQELCLNDALLKLNYGDKVKYVYDPVRYASVPHCQYLERMCTPGPSPLMLLGMNPGPWGMVQTGVS